jgi:small multidrug resistance family-3 protein
MASSAAAQRRARAIANVLGMQVARTVSLFVATAVCEIVGCYLAYAWLRLGRTPLLLAPAAASLAAFAWLLTLHPTAAGRTYAAYGGVYVATALLWMWIVEGQRPDGWDVVGAAVTLAGMAVIAFGPRH